MRSKNAMKFNPITKTLYTDKNTLIKKLYCPYPSLEWSDLSALEGTVNKFCDIILNDVENVFGSIGDCFDATFDDRKSKMQVVGGIFGVGKHLRKFGWHGTTCAVKHTPKAMATVANAKRELTDTLTNEYQKFQKELKKDALDEKIRQLKYNKKDKKND